MELSTETLIEIILSVLGLCGFIIARYIYNNKKENKAPLTCPIGFDCHSVVHSGYSKFLGIPVEALGMLYYALIFVLYTLLILVPSVLSATTSNLLSLMSLTAFLFSVYLIAVQIFVLKKGCSWCIVSSFISSFIFALTLLM